MLEKLARDKHSILLRTFINYNRQLSYKIAPQDHCHNGMKCSDRRCFCTDMAKQLFEPHGGFCVEPASNPRSWTTDEKWAAEFYEPQQSVVRS
jgi:hypothetical protein